MQPNTKYLGDGSKANWVSEGQPVAFDNSVLLTMAPSTVGTLLSSTHYVWYGKVSATMKTSRGAGVVTAFILMSDVKDEIDWEFIGTDVQHAQSNFYWQGTLNYTNEKNLSSANTDSEYHTYTLDWTPDSITWEVDGSPQRTLNKADTFNTTTNSFQYPQTPARVQFSLWPAGDPKNGQGTVEWAGGQIDWNSPYMTNGYYSAAVSEVKVQCYDPPSDANVTGKSTYTYDNTAGLEKDVSISNQNAVLASFYATGENMNANPDASSSSSAGPSSSATPLPDVQTVPGISGGGNRGTDTGSVGSSSSSDGSTAGGASSNSGATSMNGQFDQGLSTSTKTGSNSAPSGKGERAVQGSAFAVLVALVALIAS